MVTNKRYLMDILKFALQALILVAVTILIVLLIKNGRTATDIVTSGVNQYDGIALIGVLLGITAINIAITALGPWYYTDKIKTKVHNSFSEEFKKIISEQDIINHATDANFAKMMAYLLLYNKNMKSTKYIWVVGWCYTAIKRYFEFPHKCRDNYEYTFIFAKSVLLDCIENMNNNIVEELIEKNNKYFKKEYFRDCKSSNIITKIVELSKEKTISNTEINKINEFFYELLHCYENENEEIGVVACRTLKDYFICRICYKKDFEKDVNFFNMNNDFLKLLSYYLIQVEKKKNKDSDNVLHIQNITDQILSADTRDKLKSRRKEIEKLLENSCK